MSDSNSTAGFEAPDPSSLASLFPGYKVEYLIATGGMGAVYKAIQLSLDRPVAIKILPREFGEDESFRASFEAEAKAMARLNHPNLIGVYDFGKVDGMLFIIMEFVPGQTLYHSANGIAIAEDATARIVTAVCLGLAHAHEHGILHRDIKPSNILLDQEAHPKIGDFGLARPIGTAVKDGESIFGTPHYTAPEVLKLPNSVDARADIFSVGVVLHEMLTGCLPATDPRPPSVICACDYRFDTIIRRATHPSPHLRYASAAEMAKDISAITASPGPAHLRLHTTAPATNRLAIARKTTPPPADSSNTVLIVAASSVAAAIILALFIVLKKPATSTADTLPPPSPPPVPVATPKPTPEAHRTPEPKTETVEWKPERKPEPKPEPEPEPEPEPKPVEVAKTEPVIAKPAPEPMPTFDVPAFLDRARGIMRQKATPILALQNKELEKNLEAFERKVKKDIRQLERNRKAAIELRAEVSLTEWRTNGNRLPKSLNAPLDKNGVREANPKGLLGSGSYSDYEFYSALRNHHAVYLAKQDVIDQKFEAELIGLSATYILGLNKQIEKLTDPNELPSVKQIKDEIAATQKKSSYFICLMRGIDPETINPPEVKPVVRTPSTNTTAERQND
jgi:serine/threonine protein kinase